MQFGYGVLVYEVILICIWYSFQTNRGRSQEVGVQLLFKRRSWCGTVSFFVILLKPVILFLMLKLYLTRKVCFPLCFIIRPKLGQLQEIANKPW